MAGGSEDGVVEGGGQVMQEVRKKGLSGSMSLRTKKLGRRLSRSMSIVALKLPEKAHSISRSSSKLIKSSHRDKKNRTFELSIILPDKTQKQITVSGHSTIAEVVCEPLQEAGVVLAGLPSGPLSAPLAVPLGGPLPSPAALPDHPLPPPTALLFLGGSKAPVDPRASVANLEGEVLVVEYQPKQWDGKDLETFIAWEKIYGSTLFSAVELYGKPLLRAAVITKEEYHLLFYFLESVSEASEALTLRMNKYIESGLLVIDDQNREKKSDDFEPTKARKTELFGESKSILIQLVQEGILSQRDIEQSSEIPSEENVNFLEKNDVEGSSSYTTYSSPSIGNRKEVIEAPMDCNESLVDSIIETNDNVTTVTIKSGGQCCSDHRLSQDVSDNVWANVRWNFLHPADFGYDQIRRVKRSHSESALTPILQRRSDDIYDTLRDAEEESCGSITPYESIEDLYDCIKNAKYSSPAVEESSPSAESQSEPHFTDFYEKSDNIRPNSSGSEKSGTSSAFPFSKCSSSDTTSAFASCESTSGVGSLISKTRTESLKRRELPPPPPPPADDEELESTILLRQLFMGELMDAYGEYLSAYPYAKALLRRKMCRDEHFMALAEIRRGAAKYTIADYLELPVSDIACVTI